MDDFYLAILKEWFQKRSKLDNDLVSQKTMLLNLYVLIKINKEQLHYI